MKGIYDQITTSSCSVDSPVIARVTLVKLRFTRRADRTLFSDWVCHTVPESQQQQANKEAELEHDVSNEKLIYSLLVCALILCNRLSSN